MKLPRRTFLHLAAGAAALPAVSRIATAQSYPSRPVRLVVGFAAGSTTDILARLMGQWLSERLGQQFIVENRPGAAGNIAAETVVRAPADGYTLLMVPPASAINATLYDKLSFNFLSDLAPVAGVVRVPNVLEVNPSVPVKSVPELIDYAKANPTSLPNIPTVADFIPGYEASSWFGIAAPKDTPAPIMDALNRETNAGLADAKIMERLADMGGMVLAGSPADFGKLIADETAKWATVIKAAGIKPQ